jgi:hypothetical protein
MDQPLFNPQQQAGFAALGRANPALFGQPSLNGGVITACATDRVMLAGGQLSSYLIPESIVPFEAVFRRLPIDGIFTATPSQQCEFEMGFVHVPETMGFVVLDTRFAIYRPSGSAAGDFVELEDNRLSTQVGWDIKANANRQGNYHYELNPLPPANASSPAYQSMPNLGIPSASAPGSATDDDFAAARASSVQSPSFGLSLMPQRHFRQGLLHVPAPWILHSSEDFIMSCSVFRAIPIPVGFFEASVFGFLMPDSNLIAMQKAIAPCITKSGGV